MMEQLDFTQRYNFPDLEEKVLDYWDEIRAFQRSVDDRPGDKPYTFFDGPPFVTGTPHYGNLLGSITKDVVPRYWTMKGYRVERQWGWDCHGLPIENMIEKDLGIKDGKRGIERLGVANFNNACRAAIAEFDATWEVIVRRIGRWVDFKNSYKTMDFDYMESVWWGFKELYDKGLVYEGRKVILYCPRCATPLSSFEIAMDNSYVDVTDTGTTYKFKVAENTYLLAWSTTPWTKLGTMALAVNPELTYVRAQQGDEFYILAEARLEQLKTEPEYRVIEKFSGAELIERYPKFEPHFDYANLSDSNRVNAYRVVGDSFVTSEGGAGVVTLAVYGEDDYRVMQANQIPLFDYVDDEGRLNDSVRNQAWVGMKLNAANPLIDADLQERGLVYRQDPHQHSVATCYRCGTKLYYAPLPAWFVAVQKLKKQLLAENEKINWYPAYLKHGRFGKGIETAPDWNISRSRYWGTPMPVWRSEDGRQRIIGSVAELKEWAVQPDQVDRLTDIHREFVDEIEVWVDEQRQIKGQRIKEVFDCWVESSSMPFASRHYPFENKTKFERSYPAQFISEYINQTRAWFYTMHVLSVGLFGGPAYLNAHNTGVIQAEDGAKMSKSKKNYTDPMELLNRDGADALRLYLMASPVAKAENLNFSPRDVTQIRQRVLNIWWNVFVFFQQYRPSDWQLHEPRPEHVMDRWILALLEKIKAEVSRAFESYDLVTASRSLIEFVGELSTWYLRQSRDRLRLENDREGWNTFGFVLRELAKLAAPVTPFLAETTYQYLSPEFDSVHLDSWPEANPALSDETVLREMASIRPIVEAGHAQRKAEAIKVRQPLALVAVAAMSPLPETGVIDILRQELNVKQVDWKQITEATESLVRLDTAMTEDLRREGEAREIVRSVQQLRAEKNVPLDAKIRLTLPEWPEEFEQYIKQKTRAVDISRGDMSLLVD
jgi:isoleucyl-tRNA synthetase